MLKMPGMKLDTAKTTDDELKWQQSTYWNWRESSCCSHFSLHPISPCTSFLMRSKVSSSRLTSASKSSLELLSASLTEEEHTNITKPVYMSTLNITLMIETTLLTV